MLSENLRTLRRNKGLSQEEFAQRLCVVRQTVSKWEQGLSQPDADTLTRIAEQLDTTVAALLDQDAETPPVTQPVPRKRSQTWKTVLLIAGAPLWLPLGIAGAAVCLALYASLWAVIVSLWACFGALVGSAAGGVVGGMAVCIGQGNLPGGMALIAAGLTCAGVSVFWLIGCRAATKGTVLLTKKIAAVIARAFPRKEDTV